MLEVLICCYGDYPNITVESIKKIIMLADKRSDLRIIVGTNACGKETIDVLRIMLDKNEIAVLVESTANRNKDATMRVLMEYVERSHFVWFDDDTYPHKNGWDTRVQEIVGRQDFDVAGFIHVTHRDTYPGYKEFLSKRPWFKGWDVFQANPDKNIHDHAVFPHGAFFIAKTEFLRSNNYPDRDMIKKADDMLLGELCAQQGGRLIQADCWNFIKLNDSPRRGTGETAQDGWKGVVLPTVKAFDGLTIYPTGGMCNRLRNIITAIVLCREEGVPLRVVWENDSSHVAGIDLLDYWTLPVDVTYESVPCSQIMEMHEREAANRYLRIPRGKLRGAYHNHWGFCCLEGEEVDERRLIQGLKMNVLPLKQEWQDQATPNYSGLTGVHVRAFEFLFGERHEDQIQKQITLVIGAMKKEPLGYIFFLATDSKEIQRAIQEAFPGRVLIHNSIVSDYPSRQSKGDFEKGILDLYILGMCKKVLGTPGSSFSHLAGLMAGEIQWITGASRSTKEWEG